MKINKCSKCGSFITTDSTICESCLSKQDYDMTLLKNYFDENSSFDSISAISATTGVAPSIIEKYINENNYSDTATSPTTFTSIQY